MDDYSSIIINAVDKIKNAVVKIDVFKKQGNRTVRSGTGSGFVFSSDGMIFTNNHVISTGHSINVTLLDGSEYKADIIGKDADTDLAIIKIYGNGYSVADLGDSDELKIGQLLIAIGNPLGYQHTVTTGVLSGVGRTLRSANGHPIDNVLQSDAALNPGSSGGPMINTNGKVIGINTAIIRGAQGLSFAIDINTAKEVAKHLIKDGHVKKAYLGISIQEIEIHPRIINFHKLESIKGILIVGVSKSSPAQKSGLQEGDIIIKFDGKVISSASSLFKGLTGDKILNPVKIKFLRRSNVKEAMILPVEKKAG